MNNNIDNIDNSNNKDYGTTLFFSVWRNVFLRDQIKIHIKRYRQSERIIVKSMNELLKYPYRRYIKEILIYSNEELKPFGIIPYGAESIVFGNINRSISKGDLPSTIRQVFFTFSSSNLDIKSAIPRQVTTLHLPKFEPILENDTLPPSLTDLVLDLQKRDLVADVLPKSLVKLCLFGFNRSINGSFNSFTSLKSLNIGQFNQELNQGDLPDTLEELVMYQFAKPLSKGTLPSNLKKLALTLYNHQFADDVVPASITHLDLYYYNKSLSNVLPNLKTLKRLRLQYFNDVIYTGQLANTLESLSLLEFNHPLVPGVLPSSLRYLYLGAYDHDLEKGTLPNGIVELDMVSYNQDLGIGLLPETLEKLSLSHYQRQLKANDLPNSITHLKLLSYDFGFEKGFPLPSSLIKLQLGFAFVQPLKSHSIPPSCTEIILDGSYRYPIPPDLTQRLKIIFQN